MLFQVSFDHVIGRPHGCRSKITWVKIKSRPKRSRSKVRNVISGIIWPSILKVSFEVMGHMDGGQRSFGSNQVDLKGQGQRSRSKVKVTRSKVWFQGSFGHQCLRSRVRAKGHAGQGQRSSGLCPAIGYEICRWAHHVNVKLLHQTECTVPPSSNVVFLLCCPLLFWMIHNGLGLFLLTYKTDADCSFLCTCTF